MTQNAVGDNPHSPLLSVVPDGSLTSARGFRAGAVYAGIKAAGEGKRDLGLLVSDTPCAAAAVFTRSAVKAAPLLVCQEHLADGVAQAIIVNSGVANAVTGAEGLQNAREMARLAADKLGVRAEDVIVASTGVIGAQLPMDLIRAGLAELALSPDGGLDLQRAMMTTDTRPKNYAVRVELPSGAAVTIGGAAKGAGMIHPDLATLLVFVTSDAAIEPETLRAVIQPAADRSFNAITIDGDTSTNDTLAVLANGAAGNAPIQVDTPDAEAFAAGLTQVCRELAIMVARDGEGAEKLIEVTVEGAPSEADARLMARTIAGSPLVKTAIHGNDPNWGRVLMAAGRSGAPIDVNLADLHLQDVCLLRAGTPRAFDRDATSEQMRADTVRIRLSLHLGEARATGWGCDLTEEYVRFNSEYTT